MYKEFKEERAHDRCPLCDGPAMKTQEWDISSWMLICAVCGRFRVTEEFLIDLPGELQANRKLLYKLSYRFRQEAEQLEGPSSFPVHRREEIPALLRSIDPSVTEKLEALLRHFARSSAFPGQAVDFDPATDYPLAYAQGEEEASFFLKALSGQAFLEVEPYTMTTNGACTVTTRGWLELERLKGSGGGSSNAFVAMWFDKDRAVYDDAIGRAVRAAGYTPVRIDRVEHVNRIDDEIIARIRSSRFLIADFTGQRNGVYFEAGFMLGLGRPVIWLCEKAELDKVHFDTRQYNTIDYTDQDELAERLQVRIEALLGKGPISPE